MRLVVALMLASGLVGCGSIDPYQRMAEQENARMARIEAEMPERKRQAEAIIKAQKKEIEEMVARYAAAEAAAEARRTAEIRLKRAQGYVVCENFDRYKACK